MEALSSSNPSDTSEDPSLVQRHHPAAASQKMCCEQSQAARIGAGHLTNWPVLDQIVAGEWDMPAWAIGESGNDLLCHTFSDMQTPGRLLLLVDYEDTC